MCEESRQGRAITVTQSAASAPTATDRQKATRAVDLATPVVRPPGKVVVHKFDSRHNNVFCILHIYTRPDITVLVDWA